MPDVTESDPSPGLESVMDSFFSETPESTPSDDAVETPESAAEPVADPQPEGAQEPEVAEGEQTDPEPPAEEPTEDLDLDDEITPPVSKDGKRISIEVPKWNKVYANHKLAQAIQEFAPSVEAARNQYETANDYRAMHSDFQSADPANVDAFLDHWANESRDGFATMANRLPEKLQSLNPEAYQSLQSQFIQSKIEELYAEAAESGDPQAKYHAQLLDYRINGKYRTELQRPDPMAQRQAELDRRQAALDKAEADRATKVWTNFSTRIDQAKTNGLNAAIDKVLAPVAKSFEAAPQLLEAVRTKIANEVQAKLKGDFEWSRNHSIDLRAMKQNFDNAWKTGAKTNVNAEAQAIVDSYIARANGIIRSAAKPLISQATATLVSQNQARHAQRQRGQDRRGSGVPGAPPQRSVDQQVPANANLDQKIDAFFSTL